MIAVRPARAVLLGLLLMGGDCKNGVGGPSPCDEDAECVPICEAACGSEPVASASCDYGLRACVCECETMGADAGADADASR